MARCTPRSTLFPYTTLFRSLRVLILEDEVLVALMLEDMLTHLGYQVCGPAYTLSDARDLLQRKAFDAALLEDRKSTRLNSSHVEISYAVFCLKKKNTNDMLK